MFLILGGFFIQIIFLLSVFDIHFHSPVIHGITPHKLNIPGPAKRVVLISADGLRTDTFQKYIFSDDLYMPVPFIRSVLNGGGKWGVSHTRVPTESRPGHVAIAAGLYEDPSAVFRGWKENPVQFDTLFNQSSYTWAWGSPDIVPMFSKGVRGNVFSHSYSSQDEDFTGNDASKLDSWVFEKFHRFIISATVNDTLKSMMNQQGNIFFLHLLGLDTNGHTNKPFSDKYKDNLIYVDQGIGKIQQLVNEFFQDNDTAFVFTSDHGMTDWGSHGAGDSTETETPLVAWGAGINDARSSAEPKERRIDLEQADIAPLIACLLGINIPVNSVGKLPVLFIRNDDRLRAECSLANAKQLRSAYEALHDRQQEKSLSWRFHPFDHLEPNKGHDKLSEAQKLISVGLYEDSIQKSQELVNLSLAGNDYFYKYDQFELRLCITVSYVGWCLLLISFILNDNLPTDMQLCSSLASRKTTKVGTMEKTFAVLLIIVTSILLAEKSSPLYYCYYLLPVVLCYLVLRQLSSGKTLKKSTLLAMKRKHWIRILLYFAGIEVLVWAFFHRWLLSLVLLALGFWPFAGSLAGQHSVIKPKTALVWNAFCCALAVFPLLPTVGRDSYPTLVDLAGILLTAVGIWASLTANQDRDRSLLLCYTFAIPLALYVRHSVHESLTVEEPLSAVDQSLSWLLLCMPLLLPLIGPSLLWPRLIGLVITLVPAFLLLSLSYEGFFYAALSACMGLWIVMETRIPSSAWQQLRRSYFFLFFILLSFFGLGNLASVNSFDPNSVRCFVTTFSPFIMAALLVWKIVIPFILVSSALWAITLQNQMTMKGVYMLILFLSNVMALHFFHMVTSVGSWLEIGTSLSHYVIIQSTVLFVMGLRGVVHLLTAGPIFMKSQRKYLKD